MPRAMSATTTFVLISTVSLHLSWVRYLLVCFCSLVGKAVSVQPKKVLPN